MEEEVIYQAVMYTDGSCVLGSGYGGGCHGYLFTEDDYKRNADVPIKYTVTNDGYKEKYEMDADKDSLFSMVKPALYYNAVYPYGRVGTNNQAELLAVIDTIRILNEEHKLSSLIIYTDSMYVLNVNNAVNKDITNRGWLREDRPNLDLWSMLADTLVKYSDISISLRKITAHGTAIGNNVADRLAYSARELGVLGCTDASYKFYSGKYWKDKVIPHPLLNFKQIFFNAGVMPDTNENMYVIMDYPKEVELGNKSGKPLFGITITKEPEVYINGIVDKYIRSRKGDIKTLASIDLYVAYTQTHKKMFELLGNNVYNLTRQGKLSLMGEDIIATPIIPPGLAQSAVVRTLDLYSRYKNHVATQGVDDRISLSIDITDQLYDVNDKGKFIFKHLPTITGPVVNFSFDNNDHELTMVYGKDTLTRNQLKRLELDKPKVSLLIFRHSAKMFEYHTIIETDTISGIYGNYYINKIYT